jgi:hypothetical protein
MKDTNTPETDPEEENQTVAINLGSGFTVADLQDAIDETGIAADANIITPNSPRATLSVTAEGVSISLEDGAVTIDEGWASWSELIQTQDAWTAFVQQVQGDIKNSTITIEFNPEDFLTPPPEPTEKWPDNPEEELEDVALSLVAATRDVELGHPIDEIEEHSPKTVEKALIALQPYTTSVPDTIPKGEADAFGISIPKNNRQNTKDGSIEAYHLASIVKELVSVQFHQLRDRASDGENDSTGKSRYILEEALRALEQLGHNPTDIIPEDDGKTLGIEYPEDRG